LAAAELLTDTPLDANQISFLQTVQACGTSLVETVNHVLDFTKLSGNSKSGGVENMIVPSKSVLSYQLSHFVYLLMDVSEWTLCSLWRKPLMVVGLAI
jgi:hypothetical protein